MQITSRTFSAPDAASVIDFISSINPAIYTNNSEQHQPHFTLGESVSGYDESVAYAYDTDGVFVFASFLGFAEDMLYDNSTCDIKTLILIVPAGNSTYAVSVIR